jgi:hypothetical protein
MIASAKSKINIFTECSLLSGGNLGQIMDLAARNDDRFIGDQTVVLPIFLPALGAPAAVPAQRLYAASDIGVLQGVDAAIR